MVYSYDISPYFLINMDPSRLPIYNRIQQQIRSYPLKSTNILSEVKGNVLEITFNRPKRINAFTNDMYLTLAELIQMGNQTEEVKYIVVTGKGGNFSSGNDLANFGNPDLLQIASPKYIIQSAGTPDMYLAKSLQNLCKAMINSAKPLFAVVEGKCVGFAFTQLALYDRVFAVDGAEFFAPLVKIAQGPEMCASYTFPQIFGTRGYDDLIVNGMRVTPAYLQKYNFLSAHPSVNQAQTALKSHLSSLDALDWQSYVAARKLRLDAHRKFLHAANSRECKNLIVRWSNPNLPAFLKEYMKKTKQRPKL